MTMLKQARESLERMLPGLDAKLAGLPLCDLEGKGNPGLQFYRAAGGPSLVIPRDYGGRGATPLQAVRVHRALGSRSPSLAVASTMHTFSVATLVEFGMFGALDESGASLLAAISGDGLLIASGFAEGRTGTNILAATMVATETGSGGYRISGSKKPCSLTYSMDFLSASVMLDTSGGSKRRAVVLIPADAPGIVRRPFWQSSVLTGAESDEVHLENVEIPGDLLFFPGAEEHLDPIEVGGYLWFQLLVSASYLGAATNLVERVIQASKGGPTERALLGSELESAMAALESVAISMTTEARHEVLPRALLVRYSVQSAIERATMLAAELLGGMSFVSSSDVAYLLGAARGLAFHPPSRLSSAQALAGYLGGSELKWV